MSRRSAILPSLALLVGCASQAQFLASREPTATETALARGRFDLSCPAATAVVLSSDHIQPAVSGMYAGLGGISRAEYTIGVEGCGRKRVYIVICQDEASTCFAAVEPGRSPAP
jgi:hypothetical protein